MYNLIEKTLIALTVLMSIGILVMFGLLVKSIFFPEDNYSLPKSEWSCTQYEPYQYTINQMIGKVMVPQVYSGVRCTQYNKITQ
jgi:hypothetical protein